MKTQTHLKLGILASIAAAVILSACAAPSPAAQYNSATDYEGPRVAPAAAATSAPGGDTDGATAGEGQAQQPARMIIRNADLTLVVQDTPARLNELNTLATEFGGYVANTSTSQAGEGALQAQVVLRIDAAKLDAALERIRKMAVEVRTESIRGDDVTAEFVDLDAQLKNLEAAEAQLKEIMAKAEKTEDVMAVFEQLTTIRGQIEQIKGRMKYLSQSAALATVTLTLIPDVVARPVQVAGWRPEGVAKQAVEALISALQGLATLAIWFVIVLLPILILIAIPIVILIAILRRIARRSRKVAVAPAVVASTPDSKSTPPTPPMAD